MKIVQGFVAAAVIAMTAGCGVMPYQPAPNEALAPVKFVGWGSPLMCKEGRLYSLSSSGGPDLYQVPVGQPIGLGARLYSDGYNVSYSCHPWIGFRPEAGRSYVANAGLVSAGRCFIELVREDASKDTGVVMEPTLARAPACTASGRAPAAAAAAAPASAPAPAAAPASAPR